MISASSSRAVATMTGVSVTTRIIFRAFWPSRSGSPRSSTMISGGCWLISRIPSRAVPAVRTAWARRVRSATMASRTCGSSSTISTRAITRTVRTIRRACGIIADMARVLTALAAWLGGTAAAVCLAWFGAGLVVRNTTTSPAGPPVPVVSIAPPASSTGSASVAPRPPSPRSRTSTPRPSASATASPSPQPAATPSTPPAGTPRSYTLAGGQVTLLLTGKSARLVTAVPSGGFSVQTWSAPGWLRVDFSSGHAGVVADRELERAPAVGRRDELTGRDSSSSRGPTVRYGKWLVFAP